MPQSKLKAVVFDLDGTLIDSVGDLCRGVNEGLKPLLSRPYTDDEVRRMVGEGARKLVWRALPEAHRDDTDRHLLAFNAAYAAALPGNTVCFPGVLALLEALSRRGLLLMIATNKPKRFTDTLVEALGLKAAGIRVWASGDEVPERKPAPDIFDCLKTRAGDPELRPSEMVYVGDMAIDVKTARNAGLRAFTVGWGLDPEGAKAAQPDAHFDTVAALQAALMAL